MSASPRASVMPAGATVWFTGLSGSGKSSIASELASRLVGAGKLVKILDGDELRAGLSSDLSFSRRDRAENVRRIGEVALLFAKTGFYCLVTVISPYESSRAAIRDRHVADGVSFVEVFVATPIEVCEARDAKGLYARARHGEIEFFTGVSDPYEPPAEPECQVSTEHRQPDDLAEEVLVAIQGHCKGW